MEPRNEETASQPREEKKSRFRIEKLEERIAPGISPSTGAYLWGDYVCVPLGKSGKCQ